MADRTEGERPKWLVRVERGLRASFFQADGNSRSGFDWIVAIKDQNEHVTKIVVRTYPESTRDLARFGDRYLAAATKEYTHDLLATGWSPTDFSVDQIQARSIVVRPPTFVTSPLRRRCGVFGLVAGVMLICVGVLVRVGQIVGLVPLIPFVGRIVTALGAIALSFGDALIRGEPLTKGLEKRRTSLIVVLPALALFGVMLLGAALFFGENLEQPTSPSRWLGSGIVLALSLILFSALLRDVLLRFGISGSRSVV